MLRVSVPGGEDLCLEHLVLDVNGTLTDRGEPIASALSELEPLRDALKLHVLSADTFGTAEALAASLGAVFRRIEGGLDKRSYVESLGAERCVAVGNGRNDVSMLRAAGLGIAILGPEGLCAAALATADVIALSIDEALRLLSDPLALTATLRP